MIPLKDDNPTGSWPLVTFALIAANVAAFWWQVAGVGLEASVLRGGAIPYEILTFQDIEWRAVVPPPFTIFTSMFLHGGFAHLAMNMLTLWIFGNNVEDALGRVRYLAFYVVSGVAAALAQTVAAAVAGDELVPMVGASGAIAGVLAAYLVFFPRHRILTFIVPLWLLRIPAGLFIVFWFVGQVVNAALGSATGVAVFAHIGGFVAGYLLVRVVGRRSRWRAERVSW